MEFQQTLVAAFDAAVGAVAAKPVTAAAVPDLNLGDDAVLLLALGKAAVGMTQGFCDVHPGHVRGVAVADEAGPTPTGVRLVLADHPVPTERSLAAGAALLEAAASAQPHETVVVLVSGGGSSLAEALVLGVALDDLRRVTETLLRSGAPITDINAVRTSLSRLKGGGLAAAAGGGARLITLAISDVVGDPPEAIASGPTVASGNLHRASEVIARMEGAVPAAVRAAAASAADLPRRSGDSYRVVAGRADAAAAAGAALRGDGLTVRVLEAPLLGEAAERAVAIVEQAPPGMSAVFSGETTVTVSGDGVGGRNHEAALAAAIAIDGRDDIAFLAAGTDGIDGLTPGAGAVVDGETVAAGRRVGFDPDACLAANDSGRYFATVPGQIVTGRTGTNVGDVWIVVRR